MKNATTAIYAALTAPQAPRALLVTLDAAGELQWQPVGHDKAVLNIRQDLLSHLTDTPHSTAWLTELRDYLDARLMARAEAAGSGGIAIAHGRTWNVIHLASGSSLNVEGGLQ